MTTTKTKAKRVTMPQAGEPVQVRNTVDLWSGSFGNAYLERNRVDWKARVPFWQSCIEYTTPGTVFEFGCNAGWNLRAIQSVAPSTDVYGADVNQAAVNEARAAGVEAQVISEHGIAGMYEPRSMDLVITAGVLIHIPPEQLDRTMRSLIDLSGRYICAVEYDADREEEVEYRGHKGALWKRPYGAIFESMGMRQVFVVPDVEGFDNCTAYLLERPQ